MAKKYKYILFDLDGTLTDSAEGITRSVQHALKQFNIEVNLYELKPFIGPPLKQSFIDQYGFNEEKARQAVGYYREYYREKGIYGNKLYPNVLDMLRYLSSKKARLFVATSKPTIFAEKVLHNLQIESYFTLVAGSNLDGTRVNKSEVITHVLENNNEIDISKSVMVGDRKHDVIGARACNLDAIAVTYGYGSRAELIESEPNQLVQSVRELWELLSA